MGAEFVLARLISGIYDQTVGPIVSRAAREVFGKGEENKKPTERPAFPSIGSLADTFASVTVNGLLLRTMSWPTTGASQAAAGGIGASIAVNAMNGLLNTAFDQVWGRSIGPALTNTVDRMAGLKVEERKPQTFDSERFVRSLARGALAGVVYHLVDAATTGVFAGLGASIGGPVGTFVAMAAPALLGMSAGTVADTIVGGHLGSAVGSIWSWGSGKPKFEARVAAAAAAPPAEPEKKKVGLKAVPASSAAATRMAAAAVAA